MNKHSNDLVARLGYLYDCLRVSSLKYVNPHSWTKYLVLKKLRNYYNADRLIETGTYLGVTTKRCSRIYNTVDTIEIDQSLYRKAKLFLRELKNVNIHMGDCLQILPNVLSNLPKQENVIIFLDGHFSGGETSKAEYDDPVCEILTKIEAFRQNISAIVIDDFRLFGEQTGYPMKSDVLNAIEKSFPGYKIRVFFDQIILSREKID